MSFSEDVKQELYNQLPSARHCQLAELSALFWYIGQIKREGNRFRLAFLTENDNLSRKCFTLLKKAFNITKSDCVFTQNGIEVSDEELISDMLSALKIINSNGVFVSDFSKEAAQWLLKKSCCRRAFLRSAFLCNGSLTDPSKGYHLEYVVKSGGQADFIRDMLLHFDISANITTRKDRYVVYVKDSSKIVDALNVMEAPVALMNMENERIIKEMRNDINRRVNCETANINKTVNASTRQVEDINYIIKEKGLDYLPMPLREMAVVRLENPDSPLKELGELLDPHVGKSGVNHRLRKISELADDLRMGNTSQKK